MFELTFWTADGDYQTFIDSAEDSAIQTGRLGVYSDTHDDGEVLGYRVRDPNGICIRSSTISPTDRPI
jgi:hypothetical protein